MAVKFEFMLTDEDTDRVFALMQADGIKDKSANDYVSQLVSSELYKRHPQKVVFDDETKEIVSRRK